MRNLLLLFSLLMLFTYCTDDPVDESGEETVLDSYPNQPAEVIRRYQASIDSNHFLQAKLYSTLSGQAWIDTLSKIINSSGEDLDSTLLQTQFLQIDCQIQQDTALCNCLAEDQDGKYEMTYTLLKVDEKWKVEAPEEDDLWIDEQMIQDMIQQFMKE